MNVCVQKRHKVKTEMQLKTSLTLLCNNVKMMTSKKVQSITESMQGHSEISKQWHGPLGFVLWQAVTLPAHMLRFFLCFFYSSTLCEHRTDVNTTNRALCHQGFIRQIFSLPTVATNTNMNSVAYFCLSLMSKSLIGQPEVACDLLWLSVWWELLPCTYIRERDTRSTAVIILWEECWSSVGYFISYH